VKVLITGSGGFIGGSVGRYLVRVGYQVLGTARSANAPDDWPGEYLQADLSSNRFAEIVTGFGPDVLVHAAGSASVSLSLVDPLADLHDTAFTCAQVLDGVRQAGAKPLIILPSSAAVFGNPTVLPINEETPVQPISPYGFHKAVSELLAREYAECFDLNIVVCRFFSVFGFAQRRLLVWELYKQLVGPEQTVWIDGSGSESRDFLYIEDLAAVLVGLIEKLGQTSAGRYLVLNVGSGIETDVMTLAKQLQDLVAPDKEIRCRGNVRKNDPVRWCADVSRLKALLPSWQPRSLSEGLALCVAAWQEENRFPQHGP
jgi:UDP-glucose 4-epimerase